MTALPLLFVGTVVRRDWRFLAVTMVSCTVAATVATFQFSVYNSFRQASAVVPRAVGADFWVKARSVECFDFPSPFAEDYAAALERFFPGAQLRRVVFGFAPWRSPTGTRGNVAVVGIDRPGISPIGFKANASDLARLDLGDGRQPLDASIGDTTLTLEATVDNLSTYLGAPYVVTDFETARRLLRMDPSSTAFLAGSFVEGRAVNIAALAPAVARTFPEVEVVGADAFALSSIDYWQRKTGAGLAIGLAAILAMLLMVILFANGVLRFVQRYYTDLLSLLGHGASRREIGAIIAAVTLVIGAVTLLASALVTPVLVLVFRPLLPWVTFGAGDLLIPLTGVCGAMLAAMVSARRAIADFGPDAIFRS
jgi:hypothetical protein